MCSEIKKGIRKEHKVVFGQFLNVIIVIAVVPFCLLIGAGLWTAMMFIGELWDRDEKGA